MTIRDLMAGYATYTTATELSATGAEFAASSMDVTTTSVTFPLFGGMAEGMADSAHLGYRPGPPD
jgi:hypothetical protein